MGQSWTALSTQALEDSDPIINANFETLRSSFSGTSYPTSPVGGQFFFNTTNQWMYAHSGAVWREIFDTTAKWGRLLHRSRSVDYPMEAALYLGGYQAKNAAKGTADTDLTTVAQVRDDFIDSHYHSGDDNDGPQVKWDELDGHNATSDSLLQIAYGGSTLSERRWALGETWTQVGCGGTMTPIASTTCAANANELKLIMASFVVESTTSGVAEFELTYAIGAGSQTQITLRSISKSSGESVGLTLAATQRLTEAATYTLRLNGKSTSGAHYCICSSILVF